MTWSSTEIRMCCRDRGAGSGNSAIPDDYRQFPGGVNAINAINTKLTSGARRPCRGPDGAGTALQRGLIGSGLYDSTSDENFAYFRRPRLALVVLVALDNGDPVITSIDRKLGSRGECSVERRCDVIRP
jgi:hypothetical protein